MKLRIYIALICIHISCVAMQQEEKRITSSNPFIEKLVPQIDQIVSDVIDNNKKIVESSQLNEEEKKFVNRQIIEFETVLSISTGKKEYPWIQITPNTEGKIGVYNIEAFMKKMCTIGDEFAGYISAKKMAEENWVNHIYCLGLLTMVRNKVEQVNELQKVSTEKAIYYDKNPSEGCLLN